tara:strand:+ start:12153 stop:13379 length:1227 start_codon:yes stop_codon:yes gene_type:complete
LKSKKDYNDIVAFLFNQYPSFQNKGKKAYKPYLSNIQQLCKIIGNPEKSIKTIHVAGTNGKGSVCNMIYNIYKKNGYKVGLFTSPHLEDFRERIVINDEWITKDYLIQFYTHYQTLFLKIKPSFFEWTTALAFSYFEKAKTEINIIETGLGGRLDSTNIISPELAVITSIGMDHENILGNNLQEIAKEKAGIIKENTPTLLGPEIEEFDIFESICKEKKSPLHTTENINFEKYNNLAKFQIKNWETAKKAVNIVTKDLIIKDQPKEYISIKGRWHVLGNKPRTILDIGHNQQGMNEIKKQLFHEKFQQLHIVLGFSKDKNIKEILPLIPKADYFYLTKSKNERSLDPDFLYNLLNKKNSSVYFEFKEAFLKAKNRANENDLVLITGSAFLVGDILKEFYEISDGRIKK